MSDQPTATTVPEASATDDIRLEITDTAVTHLKKALEGTADIDDVGLKVSVHPGGCSGFSYGLEFQDSPDANDMIIEQKGVQIFLDKNAAPLLDGITIDFIDSLMGGGFKIENPNASSTCGCGKSFS